VTNASANDFNLAFLRALEAENENVFFSGASLRTALGMTALGARGQTLDEMVRVLALKPDPEANASEARSEAERWKAAAGKAQLLVANRLFIETSLVVAPTFLSQAASGYQASAGREDFIHQAESSRKNINRWVSDRTKQRIKDLVPEGGIDSLTRMVLANAIYFKGVWVEAFSKSSTRAAPFETPAGSRSVPTMHRTARMSYAETDQVQLVELPYKDSDLALLVALPKQQTNLASVVRDLHGDRLAAWATALHPREVSLALPKFEFTWGRSVKQELMALGIREAFLETKANFSGMLASGKSDLLIDDVFHKGFVLVDEVGTEAAAATTVVMRTKSAPLRPLQMNVDRPFLFFVRNGKTGELLFAGRVTNPLEKG
jgi:serpin B